MLGKIKQAIEAGKSAVADAAIEADASETQVVALLVLNTYGSTAEGLRKRHLTACAVEGARALFILDRKSEQEHHNLDLLCEYLPSPEDLARTTGERPDCINRYVEARLRLILDKWTVRECRWFGDSAAEIIDRWIDGEDTIRRPVEFLPAR